MALAALPCAWPWCLLVTPVKCCCNCLDYNWCGGKEVAASQYVVLTENGVHLIRMEDGGCTDEEDVVSVVPQGEIGAVLLDDPNKLTSWARSCCAVTEVPKIALYRYEEDASSWWSVPVMELNGFDNHVWFAQEIANREYKTRGGKKTPRIRSNESGGWKDSNSFTPRSREDASAMSKSDELGSPEARLQELEAKHEQHLVSDAEFAIKKNELTTAI
mmetsp:Transcript_14019/g.41803  ORF Transcript_14019/g.41803 Transcript_14019/m.41803 type:complete len:217 (-) Transcript_14019:244-894(-)